MELTSVATATLPLVLLPGSVAGCATRHLLNDRGRNAGPSERMIVGERRIEPLGGRTIRDTPRAQSLDHPLLAVCVAGVNESPPLLATNTRRLRRLDTACRYRIGVVSEGRQTH